LTSIGSIFCGSGQLFMVWDWNWKISAKNVKFLNFFLFGSKKIPTNSLICYCVLQSPELYPWLNFGNVIFFCHYFVFLIIKSGFLFLWSAQPSILTVVNIRLDNYLKTNSGVKNLPGPGIEPQSLSPQPVVIALSYNDPMLWSV